MNEGDNSAAAPGAGAKGRVDDGGVSNASLVPSISLPKGGGAITGLGEKFAANPVTGTGSLTVPVPTSAGRSGFGPKLSLSYDSGSGNGPFGMGFVLSLPSVTCKTDKGRPRYDFAGESDVFILSGAEDLVPVLEPDGRRAEDTTTAPAFVIQRYRPRIEGTFALIERWTNQVTGEVHWRSITRDNVTTLYGVTPSARVADPADATHVFSWLICASYDDKGDAIVYEWVPEDEAGVDQGRASERDRTRSGNRYLKRIKYGNRVSRLVEPDLSRATWLFEVVFDYEEGHYEQLPPDAAQHATMQHERVRVSSSPSAPWAVRPDPFSLYRACFEVRSYRRCRRVLMFHRFEELNSGLESELASEPYLVRALEFDYADLDYARAPSVDDELAHQGSTRFASFIRAITHSGFVRDDSCPSVERDGVRSFTYLRRSLPPLEFEYSKAHIHEQLQELEHSALENLPSGVDGARYKWVDLDGEGAPGIFAEQGGELFYKANLGGGHFAPVQRLRAQPALFARASGGTQLLDLSGDGQLDAVSFEANSPGFCERTQHESWESFRTFRRLPQLRWDDPNLRFIDLDGDGLADVLVTENDCFTWYRSLGAEGFDSARRVRPPQTREERGPRLVFADGTQSIYVADLAGDGPADLVRIRNGEVCYWPNLGYGRFGAKVTMDNAPWFDTPDQFQQSRVRLADIDGSGTTDIIYLGRDGTRLYFNQSGNGWSEARALPQLPVVDSVASVTTADLLGNGTACLVWSSPLPFAAGRPLRFVDLMGGQKPHLLVRAVNNLGSETRVEYASSTKFYFADKLAGRPWITRLPFPVHVVERAITNDGISGNRFSTRYTYHHGYFDGFEREFRGFGLVEQLDTEEFDAFADGAPPAASNVDPAFHVPPVLTKTWFHTGVYRGRDRISNFFAGLLNDADRGEYYREPGLNDAEARELLLPDTVMPAGLTVDEEREACRALKGMMLRQEVYALDHSERAEVPFTVVEQNFTIVPLQARGPNRHSVFFTHPREALSYQYERIPNDPRVGHTLTLEVDAFGNVLRSLSVGYGRRLPATDPVLTAADRRKQTEPLLTYTQSRFTENVISVAVRAAGHHRTPLPAETLTYELTGFKPRSGARRFSLEEWAECDFALLGSAEELPYESVPTPNRRQKRLIEQVRTLYRRDDLTGLSPLAVVEAMALPGESYKLAFTPSLIEHVFRRARPGKPNEQLLPAPSALLEGTGSDEGGYLSWDGGFWIRSGRVFFDPEADTLDPARTAPAELEHARPHFFMVRKGVDAFGQPTLVDYDAHDLLVVRTTDPLANVVLATGDYRVLQPREVTDANRNRTGAAFDALGMVVATARMGKPEETLGDVLTGFAPDPSFSELQAFLADPTATAASLLGQASTRIVYDLERYRRAAQPPFAATLVRETHARDPGGDATKIQLSFSYSDGFGREIQKKIQAEPGLAPKRAKADELTSGNSAPGALDRGSDGALVQADAPRRWVGSGRTVFNNKGKPVKQYEPFFTATHLYEPEREMTDTGVSSVLFYDPVGRVIATLHPNHTYEKALFDPWQQTTFDVNDTVASHGSQTGDPRTDPDIARYVAAYFRTQPSNWLTWYAERSEGALGPAERTAAKKAALHADTPSVSHLDVLGRSFVSVAHNRYSRKSETIEEKLPTRTELDIEGNPRVVRDAFTQAFDEDGNATVDPLGRVVARYDYDMLGTRIHQASMEAGERWTLSDALGKPIRAWDSRGFVRRVAYDELRRPTALFVTESGAERLAERTVYGEGQGDAKNHRQRVFQRFDAAGVVTLTAYDFKGNPRESRRELLPEYRVAVDWQTNPAATDGSFTSSTTYDALNRPLTVTSPDGSVYQPTFNEANLLERIDVRLRGADTATPFVTNVDYNAKGQRERIDYGNGSHSTYSYDPLTFRMTRLHTRRPSKPDGTASQIFSDPSVVQDLRYTYDPVGNLTRIEDAALVSISRGGEQIDPVSGYTYDAIYRLIEATGREHIGQTAFDFKPPGSDYRDYPFVGSRVHANDLQALRNYKERYEYDAVGNFKRLLHRAAGANWTRSYDYEEASLLEPTKKSNRLARTAIGNGTTHVERYSHDAHGNMTSMPHLAAMEWDFKDQLQRVDLGGGGTAYYVYDSRGRRIRKVIEDTNARKQKQRIYLDNVELYREYDTSGVGARLERETLRVMANERHMASVETETTNNGSAVSDALPSVRYQFGNNVGSTSVELASDGALITYEEYSPYGMTAVQTGRRATELSLKRYRYTGRERDEETGLSYHGARYCAPWLARWTSSDPIGIRTPGATRSPEGHRTSSGSTMSSRKPISLAIPTATNLFAYVDNRPTFSVDPDGREPRSTLLPTLEELKPGAGTSEVRAVGGHTGASPTSSKSQSLLSAKANSNSGKGKGFFETIVSGLRDVSAWMRDWLPGLIAAPLAGLVDVLAGAVRSIGGIISGNGGKAMEGLKDMGLGALSMLGLKEVATEKWDTPIGTSGDFKGPKTLSGDIKEANTYVWKRGPRHSANDPAKNGMHAWHAATNAALANRIGAVGAGLLWIAGVVHESPIDWKSFNAEQEAQGSVNHTLDSLTDIVANTFGITLGLLLPKKVAMPAAAILGNYIPGPGDPDPTGAGTGGYTGNPVDAWGQYPH